MSLFQKRHYEWLAQVVSGAAVNRHSPEVKILLRELTWHLAADNQSFDRQRFWLAMGLSEDDL